MGVEGFKSYLFNDKVFNTCFQKHNPKDVSSVFIDCNGIFYKASEKVYLTERTKNDEFKYSESERKKLLKKSRKKLEELHMKGIVEIIISIVEELKPRDNLVIAVDGPVNSAKLVQQKFRRFKTAKISDPYKIFDTTSLTPGTEFMVRLDRFLENWIKTYEGYLPKKTIYSSFLDPGEGEHKIFDYYRKNQLIKGKGANIIYGLDNDLIILSVVNKIPRMFLKPEPNKINNDILDIDKLKNEIINLMNFPGSDKKAIIRDFCLVCTILGNDFLHKFPNVFFRASKTMKLIFKIYKQFLRSHLTDNNNNIIWENYLNFLKIYNNYENKTKSLYVKVYENTRIGEPKYGYKEIENNIVIKDRHGNITNQVYNPNEHKLVIDYNNFKKDWYSKQFREEVVQWNGDIKNSFSREDIFEMCLSYLKTIQWVQYYYTKGYKYVSNLHFYHYLYNPLMGDVVATLNNIINAGYQDVLRDVKYKKGEIKITPIHQLLSVLNADSINNIPEQFRPLYFNYLSELNPETYEKLYENYSKPHQISVNLPLVNVAFIDEKIKESHLNIPKYLKEKREIIITRDIDDKEDYSISHNDLI